MGEGGCLAKRTAKQKKRPSIFNLHELLCNDADQLASKPKAEEPNSKEKKTGKEEEEDEDDEFSAFLKKQLEAKKRKKVAIAA